MSPLILGVGLDIVEIARFERSMARHGETLIETLFTETERARQPPPRHRARHWAAGFAVKEAVLKALGTGWSGGVSWHDVELNYLSRKDIGENGSRLHFPAVTLSGVAGQVASDLGAVRLHSSVTGTRQHAAAVAVLEGGE